MRDQLLYLRDIMHVDRTAPQQQAPINYEYRVEEDGVRAIRIDLSSRPDLANAESANNTLQRILITIFAENVPSRLDTLIARASAVSGSSIMGLPDAFPACLHGIASTLRVLDFSQTNVSATAFKHLPKFTALEEAYFDGCPKVDLQDMKPHAKLRVLSLTGTKVSVACLRQLLTTFPSLERLDCTIDLDEQAPIGFKNAATLPRPLLNVGCGHFHIKKILHKCSTSANRVVPIHTLSVRISKIEQRWQVQLLDVFKNPIEQDQPLFLHEPCCKLYSLIASKEDPCTECKVPIGTHLHPVHHERDSTLNVDTDFERFEPITYWEMMQRREELYAKMGGDK